MLQPFSKLIKPKKKNQTKEKTKNHVQILTQDSILVQIGDSNETNKRLLSKDGSGSCKRPFRNTTST
jgi:predicted ribosome quality control (RQC) complex YloA/Tae2 family protein